MRRNSDCSDTQTRFSPKAKVRNRVNVTRRIKKLSLQTEIRRVNGESPVSSSESDLIYNKKKTKQKTHFFGSTRSNLELLTGIVRNKTTTTLINNINFVSFCDGIAIVRTLKLVFPRKQKSAIASTVNLRLAVPKRIKKDRTIKLARSVLELLTGIVRNKTITTLNNNINFVSFCNGIAIVRTRKLGFSRKQKSAIASP